ncbi:helix-turn-helix domain-containing protein [Mesorhizobium japonicum]|uniref:Mll9232 protein n=1 Tax=Mesorhizobium japonicum (strain LMG 29417 / CECT 9101 / MAFF 303099) TaxID=266835 RepID=Q981U3_RHILO|nr:helix-turn-helix transcriptional regulator [Mesorhizobium japonicum]BAB54616.1 mll9232 [Mesorhizobium japonicum MAFF 303099]
MNAGVGNEWRSGYVVCHFTMGYIVRAKGPSDRQIVRTHRFMKRNGKGEVDNPLRANIATVLEAERRQRRLRHQDMAKLFHTSPGKGLAYRTYIKTARRKNNVTLRTLDMMARSLRISIATLLTAKTDIEPWVHELGDQSIRKRLGAIINSERERRNLLRYQMAELIGVSEITFAKLERGAGNISVDTIAGIAKSLCLDPTAFLFQD